MGGPARAQPSSSPQTTGTATAEADAPIAAGVSGQRAAQDQARAGAREETLRRLAELGISGDPIAKERDPESRRPEASTGAVLTLLQLETVLRQDNPARSTILSLINRIAPTDPAKIAMSGTLSQFSNLYAERNENGRANSKYITGNLKSDVLAALQRCDSVRHGDSRAADRRSAAARFEAADAAEDRYWDAVDQRYSGTSAEEERVNSRAIGQIISNAPPGAINAELARLNTHPPVHKMPPSLIPAFVDTLREYNTYAGIRRERLLAGMPEIFAHADPASLCGADVLTAFRAHESAFNNRASAVSKPGQPTSAYGPYQYLRGTAKDRGVSMEGRADPNVITPIFKQDLRTFFSGAIAMAQGQKPLTYEDLVVTVATVGHHDGSGYLTRMMQNYSSTGQLAIPNSPHAAESRSMRDSIAAKILAFHQAYDRFYAAHKAEIDAYVQSQAGASAVTPAAAH